MIENAAIDTLPSPQIKPRDVEKTGKCKWCKTVFVYHGRDVHKIYCNSKCRKAAWMHDFAVREAEKIIKRRQRAREKKLREQQTASVPSLSKNGKPGTTARATKTKQARASK